MGWWLGLLAMLNFYGCDFFCLSKKYNRVDKRCIGISYSVLVVLVKQNQEAFRKDRDVLKVTEACELCEGPILTCPMLEKFRHAYFGW